MQAKEKNMHTILLIESDIAYRQSTAAVLKSHGYAVIPMLDGDSALAAIKQGMGVDLIITSSRMNNRERLDMLAAIKEIDSSIPMIIVTDDPSIESYLKAISFGVFEYLIKPVNPGELCRVVKSALKQSFLFIAMKADATHAEKTAVNYNLI